MRRTLALLSLAALAACADPAAMDTGSAALPPAVEADASAPIAIPSGAAGGRLIHVADLENPTDLPLAFSLSTPEEGIRPERSAGFVPPHTVQSLYARVSGELLAEGESRWVTFVVGLGDDAEEIEQELIGAAPPPPATCTYSFYRDYITVINGEGGIDPGLELNGYVKVSAAGVTNTYSGKIKAGATVGGDAYITAVSVTNKTYVNQSWTIDALEVDTLDPDDTGTGGNTLSFTCDNGAPNWAYTSDTVPLGNAEIAVGVKSSW